MWDAFITSMLGDRNKGYQDQYRCPYLLCPSNTDDNNSPSPGFRKPRMKFVQKVQPSVSQYRCKDCGCTSLVSVEIMMDGRECWRINPAINSGKPSFNLNWRQ